MTGCSYAGCRRAGEHFEPDGRWWFCDSHYREHLTIRREELPHRVERTRTERQERTRAVREQIRRLHDDGLSDTQIATATRLPRSQVREHRRALGLGAHTKRAQCGTRSGYVSHRSRGEAACAACAQAQRDYDNARKRSA